MCGFVISMNDNNVDIQSLTESIKHRGPDSTRYYVGSDIQCGFNRLSIVDNNEHSDQPMLDATGRYLLTFNGEIYNFSSLKNHLETVHGVKFKTHSDTEVILYGLIYEGTPFISKLDGIYAFVFIDLKIRQIIMARDMFGVKPLYFYSKGKSLYISSEIKPLRRITRNKLDLANVGNFLSYGFVGNGHTLISDVNELEPNTVKIFSADNPTKTTTIRDFVYDQHASFDLNEISAALDQTIKEQKPSIPYGVLFSGGIDSTFLLKECFKDPHFFGTYSVDVNHEDMSEKKWQSYVTNVLGMKKKSCRIDLDKNDFALEKLASISKNMDHPLFHPNFIGSYLLTKVAAQDGLKVLLSGEGADELFMGYRWFFADVPPASYLEYIPLNGIQKILGNNHFVPVITDGLTQLEIFQKKYLQRWLIRQDLTGMANSVEVRVPFLGLQLADLINKLSFEFKRGKGESKWIIKNLLADTFSSEFLQRKKVGFDFPLNDWMGKEHLDYLFQKRDLIDIERLRATLGQYKGSYYMNRMVFSLVSFLLWHDNLEKI